MTGPMPVCRKRGGGQHVIKSLREIRGVQTRSRHDQSEHVRIEEDTIGPDLIKAIRIAQQYTVIRC